MGAKEAQLITQRKEEEARKKFVEDSVKTIPIQELQVMAYKVLTAEKYDWFIQLYNHFLQQKYAATKEKK